MFVLYIIHNKTAKKRRTSKKRLTGGGKDNDDWWDILTRKQQLEIIEELKKKGIQFDKTPHTRTSVFGKSLRSMYSRVFNGTKKSTRRYL